MAGLRTAIAISAAVVLLAAAFAQAAQKRSLSGQVKGDPETSLTLKAKIKGGKREVVRFTAKDFLIECEGELQARLGRASLGGEARVSKQDRFTLAGRNETQSLKIEGTLEGTRRAAGTLSYSGLTEFADGERECRSGKLRWRASR